MEPLIAIYIVTYRRHDMLRRAIASALGQTHKNIVVRVVNDDPEDGRIAPLLEEFADPRLSLFTPVKKRGATENFNLAFKEATAPYFALLEDDNWWEPTFLESQLSTLSSHPDARLVVGNEIVWRELADGGWLNTGRTIWPFRDVRTHLLRVEDVCGSAKICNSSMLVRSDSASLLLTPESIPVDVTEHFRERLLPARLLLNGAPLVNYAETLKTARSMGEGWSSWQYLLIGSVFVAADGSRREPLARSLWRDCASEMSPRAVALVATGFAIGEARSILWTAPMLALARFAIWIVRRPSRLVSLSRTRTRLARELEFLVDAPLTRQLAGCQ